MDLPAHDRSNDPKVWMPLYWGDYLRDTSHLSAAEHGAYLLLIGHYWVTGKPLLDDDRQLSRIARMTPGEWADARSIIQAFFEVRDGVWRHRRVEAELVSWSAKKLKRLQKARTAAEARWHAQSNASGNAPSMPQAMLGSCPSPSPSPSPNTSLRDDAAASPEGEDLKSLIWGPALRWLGKQTGKPETKLRTLVGKWCSEHGDGRTLEALQAAQKHSPHAPVPYIERILAEKGRSQRRLGKLGMAEPATSFRQSPDQISEQQARLESWAGVDA